MKRRTIVSFLGLTPLTLMASKINTDSVLVENLIRRWENSKAYTLAVFEGMPTEFIEFRPSHEQMTFAQHFLHLGFINVTYFGILANTKEYPDFEALMEANFILPPPDDISVFHSDFMKNRKPEENKQLVKDYLIKTFAYVFSCLKTLKDEMLPKGLDKVKPEYLSGHTHLDLILRGEMHTAHHRAQAVGYIRTKGLRPPPFTPYNKL